MMKAVAPRLTLMKAYLQLLYHGQWLFRQSSLDHRPDKSIFGFRLTMAAASDSTSSIARGFSVYQPTLGAPLQFFPPLGSRELDDMINAFLPGPSSAGEKRATVTLDFFEYAHLTGQAFKFYPVQSMSSAAPSPMSASSSVDSINSPYNVSPLTPSWDWSATSVPSISSSSRVSLQHRGEPKAHGEPKRHGEPKGHEEPKAHGEPKSRETSFNVASLPGMKIMTKDGVDVTNIASRGSKTKEQRDHAHLMRIIKACDNCRRKKIRCDPSHKKREASPDAAQSTSNPVKKAKTVPSEAPPPPPPSSSSSSSCSLPVTTANPDGLFPALPPFDLGSSSSLTGAEDTCFDALAFDPFEEFVQFPTMDTPDFEFLLDTRDSTSSPFPPLFPAPSLAKSAVPSSQESTVLADSDLQAKLPDFPFMDSSTSLVDYTDFHLYSPSSEFSEDERMLSICARGRGLSEMNEASVSQCPPPSCAVATNGVTMEQSNTGLSTDAPFFDPAGDSREEPVSYLSTLAAPQFVPDRQLTTSYPSDGTIVPEDIVTRDLTLADVSVSLEPVPLPPVPLGVSANRPGAVIAPATVRSTSLRTVAGIQMSFLQEQALQKALPTLYAQQAGRARSGDRTDEPATSVKSSAGLPVARSLGGVEESYVELGVIAPAMTNSTYMLTIKKRPTLAKHYAVARSETSFFEVDLSSVYRGFVSSLENNDQLALDKCRSVDGATLPPSSSNRVLMNPRCVNSLTTSPDQTCSTIVARSGSQILQSLSGDAQKVASSRVQSDRNRPSTVCTLPTLGPQVFRDPAVGVAGDANSFTTPVPPVSPASPMGPAGGATEVTSTDAHAGSSGGSSSGASTRAGKTDARNNILHSLESCALPTHVAHTVLNSCALPPHVASTAPESCAIPTHAAHTVLSSCALPPHVASTVPESCAIPTHAAHTVLSSCALPPHVASTVPESCAIPTHAAHTVLSSCALPPHVAPTVLSNDPSTAISTSTTAGSISGETADLLANILSAVCSGLISAFVDIFAATSPKLEAGPNRSATMKIKEQLQLWHKPCRERSRRGAPSRQSPMAASIIFCARKTVSIMG
ncbi:hypothetical protein E4U45_003377 [Claviceps purpurea]|nr:hypothetical protein E4U45_003377 [Claviceps purpurea]